ncbi:hypothetical protein AB0P16_11655 [Dietzia maris]|uniref:hypothetical protein n=1 Tax=Dietzia TaxID=37914 RepID=UPI000BDECA7D|nr:hypothetical protein [Dietzia sp. WMMA184]
MHLYAQMVDGHNPVTRACEALRAGRPAVVGSGSLPREIVREFFDPDERIHVRLRLQRDHAREVVDDRPPVVSEGDTVDDTEVSEDDGTVEEVADHG